MNVKAGRILKFDPDQIPNALMHLSKTIITFPEGRISLAFDQARFFAARQRLDGPSDSRPETGGLEFAGMLIDMGPRFHFCDGLSSKPPHHFLGNQHHVTLFALFQFWTLGCSGANAIEMPRKRIARAQSLGTQ
jgi:hypothetical protein